MLDEETVCWSQCVAQEDAEEGEMKEKRKTVRNEEEREREGV